MDPNPGTAGSGLSRTSWLQAVSERALPSLILLVALLLWSSAAHATCTWAWFTWICTGPTATPTRQVVVPTRTPTRSAVAPTATPSGASNCCASHAGAGCSNAVCQTEVCYGYYYPCCLTGWTSMCSSVAQNTYDCHCPPLPTPTPQPESFAAICQQAEPMQSLPEVMTALYQALACLNTNDPAHGLWTDTISTTARVSYLPTKECPQWNAPYPLCCTNVWNNYCNFTCDGEYTCDKGIGKGPGPCRVSGLTSLHDCASGTVIMLSDTCTAADGVTPANSPLKYELINALTGGAHDQQAWWGFNSCS